MKHSDFGIRIAEYEDAASEIHNFGIKIAHCGELKETWRLKLQIPM